MASHICSQKSRVLTQSLGPTLQATTPTPQPLQIMPGAYP
ncbi:hypothetical protein Gohar_002444, partial [Gossypium harknessii]|nr:hypothetical protein [Gossypium harknessii]